jgi:signal recognition particle subunit SRP54
VFDNLSEKLSGILDGLTRRGALSEQDVDAALREVRRALLEADVALDVARAFIEQVKKRAVGVEVIKSVHARPDGRQDRARRAVATLGADAQPIDLNAPAPVPIMMVGLQGSGKTTTTAKIAKRLVERDNRKVLMASLDTRRPAAMEQLAVLGQQVNVPTLPTSRARRRCRSPPARSRPPGSAVTTWCCSTPPGRITTRRRDDERSAEVKRAAAPHETLLRRDSLTARTPSIWRVRSTSASASPASC